MEALMTSVNPHLQFHDFCDEPGPARAIQLFDPEIDLRGILASENVARFPPSAESEWPEFTKASAARSAYRGRLAEYRWTKCVRPGLASQPRPRWLPIFARSDDLENGDRGIVDLPDFICNAGGLICAAVEQHRRAEQPAVETIHE